MILKEVKSKPFFEEEKEQKINNYNAFKENCLPSSSLSLS